jgi:hypothetical protein
MTRLCFRALATVTIGLAWATFPFIAVRAADATPRPRAALVIGNADYVSLNAVTSAANDEHDMCEALSALGYSTSCFTDVKDAKEFKARIQDFMAGLKPKSEVVFYYAGHAIQVKGENYLVPAAAKPRGEADVPKETISLAYIMTQLLQGKHYLNVVILDTCRGIPWRDGARGMSEGLAPITTIPHGTMVMYATAPNGYAEQGAGRNGVFTANLLANINSPGLTADELFKKVSDGVQSDSSEGAASVQTPALYTNFTGEFCFGGCIDKVARDELERIEKENEQQLEEARKQKAELETRKREAQEKLVDAAISANCDKSVLNDTGRCFAATPQTTLKAVATAFIQRGFILSHGGLAASHGSADSWWTQTVAGTAGENQLEAVRTSDDPTDTNVSEIVKVSATLRNVASIGRCVVTLSATRRTVLHDEYHTWGTIALVPVATSKQYRDVVKNDVDVIDSSFYQDLLTAIERNTRGINAAATPNPTEANAPNAGDSLFNHEHRYDAPPVRVERALIEALVAQGFIVQSLNPELGTINLLRRTQDPKDKSYSVETVLIASVTAPENGVGAQVQVSADDLRVLHRDPLKGNTFRAMTGTYQYQVTFNYETVVVHDGAVTDAGFYRGLFATIDANLQGNAAPSKHSQRVTAPADQALRAAGEALTQHGYYVSSTEERLGLLVLFKRAATPLKTNDGWTSTSVSATLYLRPGTGNDSAFFAAASSQEAMFRAPPIVKYSILFGRSQKIDAKRDCRTKKCSLAELEAKFVEPGESALSRESVTREGDADAAAYNEILSIASQSVR